MALRLGFHYHVPFWRIADGGLYTPGHQGLFLDSLAPLCDEVVCFMHSAPPNQVPFLDYRIEGKNIQWVDLGPHASVPRRLLRARQILRPLESWRSRLDALLIRGPSPLLPAVASAAGAVPLALLLVGDQVDALPDMVQPFWRKQAIGLYSRWNRYRQERVAARELTFVNSRHLYERLHGRVPHLLETRTTTLRAKDVFEQPLKPVQRPVQLLYTGRMDRAKGLHQMVEAVGLLRQEGVDAVLNLVGWAEKGDPVVDDLLHQARKLGVDDRICFHGYIPAGDALLAHYRRADVYLIGSLSSEGFPRTIWEAMASSVPVVATQVGGMPYYLEDRLTARLVPPADVAALSGAVAEVVRDESLRRRLVENGLKLARGNTLERRAGEMITAIESWTRNRR